MSDLDQNVELPIDEDNQIEEASAQKMPVGTEADSIASVDKTDDAVKKPPTRKGTLANRIRCLRPKQEC